MRLAAQDTYGVVVVLQAMDAAGKDGTIRHVMSGVNPQGVEVRSFKIPSTEELDHDYLWRYQRRLPERGHIGIFNRSYYEEVLVVRVHPADPRPARSCRPQLKRPRHLEAALPRDQRLGALPDRPGLPFRQDLPERQPRRSSVVGSSPGSTSPRRTGSSAPTTRSERAYWDDYQKAFSEVLSQHEHRLGAVVRHPGRRQAVRPRGCRRRAGRHAHRHRPAATRRSRRRGARGAPGRQGRARGGRRPRARPPIRSRELAGASQEGRKKAQKKGEKETAGDRSHVPLGRPHPTRSRHRPVESHATVDPSEPTAWHALEPDEALREQSASRSTRA